MKNILIISIVLVLISGMLIAQPQQMRHERDNFSKFHKQDNNCWDELDLSDSQKEKMDTFRNSHKKKMIGLNSEIKQLEIDLHESLKNEDYSTAKSMVRDIGEKKEEIQISRIEHHQRIFELLNDEQKEILKENKSSMFRTGMKRSYRNHGCRNRDRSKGHPRRMW